MKPFSDAPRESVLSYDSTSGSRSLTDDCQPELGACILDAVR
jgi:hypothetical protein